MVVGELQGVEVRTEGVVMEVEEGLIAEAGVVCACDLCDYQANHGTELVKHKQTVHKPTKVYTCDLCKFTSVHASAIKRHKENIHIRQHQMNHNCDACEYSTTYKSALKRHMANKHNKESLVNYKCSFCDYSSTYEFATERHITTVHMKDKEEEFSCSLCDYNTMHKFSLDRHLRKVHEREMKYNCDKCGFKTGHKSGLKMHTATVHQSRKAHSCTICGYETLYKTALIRHINTVNCKSGFKVIGAGNILKQEKFEHDQRSSADCPVSAMNQSHQNIVTVIDQSCDPGSSPSTSAYSSPAKESSLLVSNPDGKSIIINTSSVNFPKMERGLGTSVVFNTDPSISSITIYDKEYVFQNYQSKPGELIITPQILTVAPNQTNSIQ